MINKTYQLIKFDINSPNKNFDATIAINGFVLYTAYDQPFLNGYAEIEISYKQFLELDFQIGNKIDLEILFLSNESTKTLTFNITQISVSDGDIDLGKGYNRYKIDFISSTGYEALQKVYAQSYKGKPTDIFRKTFGFSKYESEDLCEKINFVGNKTPLAGFISMILDFSVGDDLGFYTFYEDLDGFHFKNVGSSFKNISPTVEIKYFDPKIEITDEIGFVNGEITLANNANIANNTNKINHLIDNKINNTTIKHFVDDDVYPYADDQSVFTVYEREIYDDAFEQNIDKALSNMAFKEIVTSKFDQLRLNKLDGRHQIKLLEPTKITTSKQVLNTLPIAISYAFNAGQEHDINLQAYIVKNN